MHPELLWVEKYFAEKNAFNCSTKSFYLKGYIIASHKCPGWMQDGSYRERVDSEESVHYIKLSHGNLYIYRRMKTTMMTTKYHNTTAQYFFEVYEKSTNSSTIWKRDARPITSMQSHAPNKKFNDTVLYGQLKFWCIDGGEDHKSSSLGKYVKSFQSIKCLWDLNLYR